MQDLSYEEGFESPSAGIDGDDHAFIANAPEFESYWNVFTAKAPP